MAGFDFDRYRLHLAAARQHLDLGVDSLHLDWAKWDAEHAGEVRSISEAMGLQHSHLVDRQLRSHAEGIVDHVDQVKRRYLKHGGVKIASVKPAKSDQAVHDRVATYNNGRGANHWGPYNGAKLEHVKRLREILGRPPDGNIKG